MDLLKAQLDRLQKQLNGLSSSQKMLTAALVAIMVMTLLWWGKYAADPEMEPVLDQAFSQEDIGRITTDLASRQIHYTVVGDRIMVPADRKIEVLAALSFSHLLPKDTKAGFDEMVKNINPLQSETVTEQMINRGKEITLARIIQRFPNVGDADVMIDPKREVRVENSVEPSATITITMQSGASANQQLVDAAADAVQGAQAGLAKSHIKVVVGGVPRRVHDGEMDDMSGLGNDQLELTQKAELSREERIKEYLSYIPGLKVFVVAKVNSSTVQIQSHDFEPKNAVSKAATETSETSESSTPSGASSEPGVVPNTAVAIPGPTAAAPPATSSQEKTSTTYENYVPDTITNTRTPAGGVTMLAATVRVPAAYFAALYTRRNPDTKDPTEEQLKPLIDAELPKIRTDVLKCTGLVAEKDVSVETYWDATPITTAAPQLAGVSVTGLVSGYGKEVVLGALAIMSLFMVSMMVRKGTPVAELSPVTVAAAAKQAFSLGGEAVAGEVGEGGSMLDGMELNEDEVRSQQMLDQVSTMVKENPDNAATLVKRWLNRS